MSTARCRSAARPAQLLHPAAERLLAAADRLGFPAEPDKNAGGPPGCRAGPVQLGRRRADLRGDGLPAARTGRTSPCAATPRWRGCSSTATARAASSCSTAGRSTAGEVVLAAGAVATPLLLLRSGHRPGRRAARRRRRGPSSTCPGSGAAGPTIRRCSSRSPTPTRRRTRTRHGSQAALNLDCGADPAGDAEVLLFVRPFTPGGDLHLMCALQAPDSRGTISITSADPRATPVDPLPLPAHRARPPPAAARHPHRRRAAARRAGRAHRPGRRRAGQRPRAGRLDRRAPDHRGAPVRQRRHRIRWSTTQLRVLRRHRACGSPTPRCCRSCPAAAPRPPPSRSARRPPTARSSSPRYDGRRGCDPRACLCSRRWSTRSSPRARCRSGSPTSTRSARSTSGPRSRPGMAEQRAEVDAITADPRAADVREHARRAGAVRADPAPGLGGVLHPGRLVQHPGHPGHRGRDRAAAGRARRRDHARRRAVRPHRRAVRPPGDELDLDPESLRLLERQHRDAVRAGARLGPAEQERLRALNAELSALTTEFGTPAAGRGERLRACTSPTPPSWTGWPRTRSRPRPGPRPPAGLDGYLITLVLPTEQPALAALTDRELRERLHAASVSRGSRGNEHDTRDLVRRIAALRAERARLLGHPHHASWVVETAPPAPSRRSTRCCGKLAPVAAANARAEAAELAADAGPPDRGRGTARSTPSGCAASASTSTPTPCAPTSSWTGCCTTASSTPPAGSTGCASPSATTCPATTPTCASSTCSTRTGSSGCSSPTSTPATPSAAAPG